MSSSQNGNTTTTTILRVKRPRDAPPLEYFRLPISYHETGTGSKRSRRNQTDDAMLSSLMESSKPFGNAPQVKTQLPEEQSNGPSHVLFTRMDPGCANETASSSFFSNASSPDRRTRSSQKSSRVRLVECLYQPSSSNSATNSLGEGPSSSDAPLEESDETPGLKHSSSMGRSRSKRRRVALHVVASKECSYQDLIESTLRATSRSSISSVPEFAAGCHNNSQAKGPLNYGVASRLLNRRLRKLPSSSTSSQKGTPILVVDPLTRMVDTALSSYFETGVFKPYLQTLTKSDYLSQSIPDARDRCTKLLSHHLLGGNHGNILHALALWNDAEGLLSLVNTLDNLITMQARIKLLLSLLNKTNADGMTPCQIAAMACHSSFQARLDETLALAEQEEFTHSSTPNSGPLARGFSSFESKNTTEAPQDLKPTCISDDYVYDVYCIASEETGGGISSVSASSTLCDTNGGKTVRSRNLLHPPNVGGGRLRKRSDSVPRSIETNNLSPSNLSTSTFIAPHVVREAKNGTLGPIAGSADDLDDLLVEDPNVHEDDDDEISVEIKGGLGYWNEKGELVLEADPTSNYGLFMDSYRNHKHLQDTDHDSNDEMYEGNDYPDEDGNDSYRSDATEKGGDDEEDAYDDEDEFDYLYGNHRRMPGGNSICTYKSTTSGLTNYATYGGDMAELYEYEDTLDSDEENSQARNSFLNPFVGPTKTPLADLPDYSDDDEYCADCDLYDSGGISQFAYDPALNDEKLQDHSG